MSASGLGPLEPLLKDPTITDILVNTHKQIYVERFGQLVPSCGALQGRRTPAEVINRIVSAVGRRVDESSPMVDARLPDGSRVNAIIPPVAVDGALLSIRKFSKQRARWTSWWMLDALRPQMAAVLKAARGGALNMLISGGTGSGKTTMLNALSSFISDRERLITIEDAAELQLQQPHVGRMETRPPTIEGKGEIRQRELVKNALRMRPDRIIVGEVRGERGLRHAPGHEHRPRRLDDHHPRQHPARRPGRWWPWVRPTCRSARCGSRLPRRSRS
jgi:pilus assembly protein CpaF